MIISLRGTHGSGKSTIVFQLLERFPHEAIITDGKKADGYRVTIPTLSKPLYVVGSYHSACGGCDGIQPYGLIWPRVQAYHNAGGHVLFEGAMVSSSYGNIGRASEEYGDDVVFAFMDTPLELCLEQIRKRREAKGNTKPLNPKNATEKFKNVRRSITVIMENKRRCVMIGHRTGTEDILRLLHGAE